MYFLEVILIGFAIYFAILTARMQTSGVINKFFVNAKIDLTKAKDPQGYIKYMVPRCYAFSAFLVVFATLSILQVKYAISAWIAIGIYIAYGALLVYYSIISVRAQKNFLM